MEQHGAKVIVKGGMEGWRQRRGKGRKEGERKEIRGKRIKYGKKKSTHTLRPSLPPKHLSGPSCSCRHTLDRNDMSFELACI